MDYPDIQKWVLLTFSDGDTIYRFLFMQKKLPDGTLDNSELWIKYFDPSDLVAETDRDAIQLSGEGFELGFDLYYLTPANEPVSILITLANRNRERGRPYYKEVIKNIKWISHFGDIANRNLCLESALNLLQPWEIND
ncbi:MAG: hypothetical protein ACQEXI_12550 [Pseudomonadota bacterium]